MCDGSGIVKHGEGSFHYWDRCEGCVNCDPPESKLMAVTLDHIYRAMGIEINLKAREE